MVGTSHQAPAPQKARSFAMLAFVWLSITLTLNGCGAGDYPSLAVRADERLPSITAPPPAPASHAEAMYITAPSGPDLDARLRILVTQARSAHQDFLKALPAAAAAITAAKGAAIASEPWSTASQALSRLTAMRSDTVAARIALENLYDDDRVSHSIDDANRGDGQGTGSGQRADAAAIAAARHNVKIIANQEDATLAAIRSGLAD